MPRSALLFAGVLVFGGCAKNSDVVALKARVADLEQKNARLEKSYQRDLASLQVKVMELERELDESESAYADASKETLQIDDDVDSIKNKLNNIRSDLETVNLRRSISRPTPPSCWRWRSAWIRCRKSSMR